MKTISSFLTLFILFTFLLSALSLTPVHVELTGKIGQRSIIYAKFINKDANTPNSIPTTSIDIQVQFPGIYPNDRHAYEELKCVSVFNMYGKDEALVVKNIDNISKSEDTMNDINTTIVNATINLIRIKNIPIKYFDIYCSFVGPLLPYSNETVKFTATFGEKSAIAVGVGRNSLVKPPINGMGIFISYFYSQTQPTTVTLRGLNPLFITDRFVLRNILEPERGYYNPVIFFKFTLSNACQLYKDGKYDWRGAEFLVNARGESITFVLPHTLNLAPNYDIFCPNLRGSLEFSDFPVNISKYLPTMVEFAIEDYSYYNTIYTTSIPVPNSNQRRNGVLDSELPEG